MAVITVGRVAMLVAGAQKEGENLAIGWIGQRFDLRCFQALWLELAPFPVLLSLLVAYLKGRAPSQQSARPIHDIDNLPAGEPEVRSAAGLALNSHRQLGQILLPGLFWLRGAIGRAVIVEP